MSTDEEVVIESKPTPEREETMETASNSSTDGAKDEPAMPLLSDEEALERAKEHMRNDQVLVAARLMKQMTAIPEAEETFHKEVQEKANWLEGVIADLHTDPVVAATAEEEEGVSNTEVWRKMGESHDGHRDTVSYYQLTRDLQLKCRIETPIESSLLVPLLSVLIESDLYTTWLPSWSVPRLGLSSVDKLAQMGRTEQIVHFVTQVPWPFAGRDVMLQTCGCDDIHDLEGPTTGSIVIGLRSLQGGDVIHRSVVCNEHYQNAPPMLDIEPEQEGLKRAEFDGGMLIRKCPDHHVSLRGSTIDYPADEHLILVGFSMRIDGKISPMFPTTIINFVIQTVIVQMWAKLIHVAEEIREGQRPLHAAAIAAKREEIYNWVDQRIEDMFALLNKTNDTVATETEEKKDELECDAPSDSIDN